MVVTESGAFAASHEISQMCSSTVEVVVESGEAKDIFKIRRSATALSVYLKDQQTGHQKTVKVCDSCCEVEAEPDFKWHFVKNADEVEAALNGAAASGMTKNPVLALPSRGRLPAALPKEDRATRVSRALERGS